MLLHGVFLRLCALLWFDDANDGDVYRTALLFVKKEL